MRNFVIEVLIVLLLIACNGVLALAEIALVSSRKVRLQREASHGSAAARIALELSNTPGRFLSTVQVGITLVAILTGTFGGATLASQLAALLRTIPQLAPASHTIALTLVVVTITYLSVVLGELVPKRLALNYPEELATVVARPMFVLSRLAHPVVWFLERSTNLLLHLLQVSPPKKRVVTEDELRMLVEQGAQAGVFEKTESEMVKAVLRLADKPVEMLMTPRSEIDWLDITQPISEILGAMSRSLRSRYPVCRQSLDDVVGVIEARYVLGQCLAGTSGYDLQSLLRPPLFIPNSATATTLLDSFRSAEAHTALVVDEYGSVIGMVTPYDLTKAVFGHIDLSAKEEEAAITLRDDGSWLIDASISLDTFKETFDIEHLPQEETGIMTLAGFVLTQLGRIPDVGDSFEAEGLRFEVIDMDAHRIDKVLVSKLPPAETEEEE